MFRTQALNGSRNRLSGDVAIAVPVSWQSVGILMFGGVVAGVLFLSFASYSRVETAVGTITPDAGVSAIVPTRTGVVANISVKDGQIVPAGAELATIRAEEDGATLQSPAALVQAAIAQQDASLAAQSDASLASAQARASQVAAQRSGLLAETAQLQARISTQRALIASAQKDLDRARAVADRGFISGRDLQLREETLLSRQQGLAQLGQRFAASPAQVA